MKRKYELTDETMELYGTTLHRIKALLDFNDVKAGDLGGWVENEDNLSRYGNAWVYGNAKIYGNAWVYGDALVHNNAQIGGNAEIYDNAKIYGFARVFGDAQVGGDARVNSNRDYIVFKDWWDSGRYFTWTRSNDKWRAGDFYGTGDELIHKAYQHGETSGREYARIVEYVNQIKK